MSVGSMVAVRSKTKTALSEAVAAVCPCAVSAWTMNDQAGGPSPSSKPSQPASTAPFVHTCGLTSHITSERSRRQPLSKKSQNPMCHEAICAVPSREHRKSGVPSHDHFSCMWLLIRARRAFPRQRTTRMLLSHNRNQSRSQVRAGSDAKAQIIQRGR